MEGDIREPGIVKGMSVIVSWAHLTQPPLCLFAFYDSLHRSSNNIPACSTLKETESNQELFPVLLRLPFATCKGPGKFVCISISRAAIIASARRRLLACDNITHLVFILRFCKEDLIKRVKYSLLQQQNLLIYSEQYLYCNW